MSPHSFFDAIYFVKFTSPSCCPQNDATTPPTSVGVVVLNLQVISLLQGNYNETVWFRFHQTRGHLSRKKDLCPYVQVQKILASSLLSVSEVPSVKDLCFGYNYTSFFQHLHKVLCCSRIDLLFLCQSMFIFERQRDCLEATFFFQFPATSGKEALPLMVGLKIYWLHLQLSILVANV